MDDQKIGGANRELAALVLKQITTHPETHYQGMWVRKLGQQQQVLRGANCDTQMCVAGWAVSFAYADAQPLLDGDDDYAVAWNLRNGEGVQEFYGDAGQKALGIDRRERAYLFAADRSEDEVVKALTELVEYGKIDLSGYQGEEEE